MRAAGVCAGERRRTGTSQDFYGRGATAGSRGGRLRGARARATKKRAEQEAARQVLEHLTDVTGWQRRGR